MKKKERLAKVSMSRKRINDQANVLLIVAVFICAVNFPNIYRIEYTELHDIVVVL